MATQIKGKCRFCYKEFTKAGMSKHIDTCKERIHKIEDCNMQTEADYFELLLTDRYLSAYWIVLEINDTASLKDLDQFIRDIWVECCGHMSSFEINGQFYQNVISDFFDTGWFPKPKSMNVKLKSILNVGMKMKYEYDFGSTTELIITVKKHISHKSSRNKINILARNTSPEIICSLCNKNVATWVNREDYDNPFVCEKCLEENDDCIDPELLLPICNSPRMGVCVYDGSSKYDDDL